jgi:uncharacterized protein (DUF1778 family)
MRGGSPAGSPEPLTPWHYRRHYQPQPALPPALPGAGMVTKLSDGRGQTTLKAHAVTDDWEQLVKAAAQRNGQTVADFVVSVTRDAAQAILKGDSAVPAGVPARQEDVTDRLAAIVERMEADAARRDAEQAARAEALAARLRRDQDEAARKLRRLARGGGRRR